ncbi:MAG: hypothetical protein M3521_04355 [Acidobacteriota bacterium]|jgi:hypothetical protein|nr:hypothetical protein [Acidobacteriota bacterium]
MKTKILASLFSFAVMLTMSSLAAAQTSNQDWSSVQALKLKTNLIVETKTGATVKGKVSGVTPTTLSLLSGGSTIALERDDVAKVYRAKKSSRLKRAFIGAGIGAAVGFGIGGVYALITKGNGLAAAAGFIYGLPTGAVFGAATGGKNRKGNLIYESN